MRTFHCFGPCFVLTRNLVLKGTFTVLDSLLGILVQEGVFTVDLLYIKDFLLFQPLSCVLLYLGELSLIRPPRLVKFNRRKFLLFRLPRSVKSCSGSVFTVSVFSLYMSTVPLEEFFCLVNFSYVLPLNCLQHVLGTQKDIFHLNLLLAYFSILLYKSRKLVIPEKIFIPYFICLYLPFHTVRLC